MKGSYWIYITKHGAFVTDVNDFIGNKVMKNGVWEPEIIEFYRLSGDIDYLLKIVVPDMKAFDKFYKRLITQADFSDISSSFAMEELKNTTRLPVEYL